MLTFDVREEQRKLLKEIRTARDETETQSMCAEFLRRCVKAGELPFLSDLIIDVERGAQPVLVALERWEIEEPKRSDDERLRWKIQVLRDEWGNVPQPGDTVTRRVLKNLYLRDGIPASSADMSRAKINGTFAQDYEEHYTFRVDDKGCISCGFTTAANLLNTYGIHSDTRRPITKKQELSGAPSQAPNGDLLHVHYWRYREVRREEYEALPSLGTTDATPKRGIANKTA